MQVHCSAAHDFAIRWKQESEKKKRRIETNLTFHDINICDQDKTHYHFIAFFCRSIALWACWCVLLLGFVVVFRFELCAHKTSEVWMMLLKLMNQLIREIFARCYRTRRIKRSEIYSARETEKRVQFRLFLDWVITEIRIDLQALQWYLSFDT